ncbi:histidinol phosphatase [Thioclava dalianensis]|uniref:Histidinol phosphatase n=1 Tax=Thioclava dalianensis TaxID=1185766 RepID=A0A074T8E6_9RHOB|nr:ABC transporter ATP-binding protein [Thioclava dalianensis]KEP68076.1 histidinol phosphatase [Thioclava dalianensis]SFM90624.1 iron complex transport system ATP-binding protein [Thioclava dalianensis]
MKIEVRMLSARVHRTPLLKDISACVESGEFFGLIGPNGSGKSTLMRCLAGLQRPVSGRILADGADLSTMPARSRARRIAFVEQQADTTDRLSVRDAVALGRTPYLSPLRGWGADDDAAVTGALRAVEMTAFADRLWHTLSGGERQRVHIARALAQDPDLLLLDEPTNHLDIRHQLSLLALVRALPITRVVALHDLNQAAACDRIGVVLGGRLVATGCPHEVLTETLLADVFGVAALRHPAPDGSPQLHFSHAL